MDLITCSTCGRHRGVDQFMPAAGGIPGRVSCGVCQRRFEILEYAPEVEAPLRPAPRGRCWGCENPLPADRDARTRLCSECGASRRAAQTDLSRARVQDHQAAQRVARLRAAGMLSEDWIQAQGLVLTFYAIAKAASAAVARVDLRDRAIAIGDQLRPQIERVTRTLEDLAG